MLISARFGSAFAAPKQPASSGSTRRRHTPQQASTAVQRYSGTAVQQHWHIKRITSANSSTGNESLRMGGLQA